MSTETNPPAASEPIEGQPQPARWNYLAWLGPVVTLVGALSYFLFFVRFPVLRDFPWVNLPMVLLGAGLSLVGLLNGLFSRQRSLFSKLFSIVGFVFSVALCGLFFVYIFSLSYQIPGPESVTQVDSMAPTFSLLDQNGDAVDLTNLQGKKAVITFYRGWW